jgi:glycosyltransferase involved in cell wall biosynthesis
MPREDGLVSNISIFIYSEPLASSFITLLEFAVTESQVPAKASMPLVQACTLEGDWSGVIAAAGHGLQRVLGLGREHHSGLAEHYLSNLSLARRRYRRKRTAAVAEKQTHSRVVVVCSQLNRNPAGRAHTLLLTYQQLGYSVDLLGSYFPLPNQAPVLWEPLQSLDLPVHAVVVNDHSQFFWQAWELVLQHPADLVHLSKPRLPAVVFGLLYKLIWGAAVLMDIDDEELCFVGEREPISVDALKREQGQLPPPDKLLGPLWTRLAVDLGQRFDGITVANTALQQRYGGTVIPHGRDPQQLRPITAIKRSFARRRYGIPEDAKVVLFFGTARRHKGLLEVAAAVATLPEALQPLFVLAGAIPDPKLQQELEALLPPERLRLLGNQPFEQARDILALADLEVLFSSGEVAAFQSPAKLSDALAVGLPVLVSEAAPLQEATERGWAVRVEPERLAEQLQQWLGDAEALARQGERAREGFLATLALPVVAEQLEPCVAAALEAPGPVDQQLLTLLESLAPGLALIRSRMAR